MASTSNPAFSKDMFAGYEQVYGALRQHDDDGAGDRQQDVRASGHPGGDRGVVVERDGQRLDRCTGCSSLSRDRRFHRGDDHDLQADACARGPRRSTRRSKESSWARSRRSIEMQVRRRKTAGAEASCCRPSG